MFTSLKVSLIFVILCLTLVLVSVSAYAQVEGTNPPGKISTADSLQQAAELKALRTNVLYTLRAMEKLYAVRQRLAIPISDNTYFGSVFEIVVQYWQNDRKAILRAKPEEVEKSKKK